MIVVLGATGYTGRLVSARLAELGRPFVAAGRSRARLEELVRTLGTGAGAATVRTADVSDPGSLARMLEGASALIDCAGPFTRLGPPVVQAAVQNGVPYCDITGEGRFIARVAHEHAAAPVPVVPGCGFDFVPHSLAAARAAGAVTSPVRIETAFIARQFVPTTGTQTSGLGPLAEGGMCVEDGERVETGFGAHRRSFVFSEDGAPLMAVSYPGGDAVQIHNQFPSAQVVRSYVAAPRGVAWLMKPALGALTAVARLGAVQRYFERRNRTSNQGPDPEVRARSSFQIVAEAEGQDGRVARALASGRDVYGSTALYSVAVANRLSDWRTLGLPAGFRAPAEVTGDVQTFAEQCQLQLSLLAEPTRDTRT